MKKHTDTPELIARESVSGGIVRATFSAPSRTASPGGETAAGTFDKIRVRTVASKGEPLWQLEQYRGAQVFHRNVPAAELESLIASWLSGAFNRAEIDTANAHIAVLANRRGEISAIRRAASAPAETNAPEHNRAKRYILAEGNPVPFLVDLGVMTADGAVVKAKYDKFRQINRFLEFIADVEPELRKAAETSKDGANGGEITIVDFGCGKSYLTFAVYYYLSVQRGLPVRIIGLDLKADVISHCAELARKYGYERLNFSVGDIASFTGTDRADMVIPLHACDTAPDYALSQAVRWNARVILSVPCCQHELNSALPPGGGSSVLAPAFRHGIIKERMAALLTDAMRAELLEAKGYRVQILEFIDMSHTPKNLLIRAVRHEKGTPTEERDDTHTRTGAPSAEYRALADMLGCALTLEKELYNGQDSRRHERRR